jgi:hypothetical protein
MTPFENTSSKELEDETSSPPASRRAAADKRSYQMSLKDQVVLVTGSSGGIGDAVVDAFTAEGVLVIGADHGPKEGQELAGFLSSKSSRSAWLPISCRTGCASEASRATLSGSHSGTSTGLSTATNSAPGQMFQ